MSQNETEAAKRERLRKQLDDTHTWPCEFSFKFIVASDEEGETALKSILSDAATFSSRKLPAMGGIRRSPSRIR